eukprot:XP_024448591.1 G-type lectin S-receptor-like serine/threonine-protein kinase CES101 [Populus trichocarpa]
MLPSMARRIYRFLLFCFCASHVLAADTLYQGGDSLNSSCTLVSKNGLFTLGFTRLGSAESNATYLGIWYNNDRSHPFWLANRDKPIADNSGVLAIDGSGNMKLTYSGGDPVEFYSSQSSTTNITAILEDSGNFVLKDENSGSQQVLWQSFDFPTDTFLPGMKLGINHRTGQSWSLMSWLSDLVPTPAGAFTFEWDTNGKELVIKRRDVIYWTSGPSRSNTSFEILSLDQSFITVSNADEDYFMFTVSANQFTAQGQRNFSMWQLEYDGSIADQGTGRTYGGTACKGNNTDGGCERWSGPACRSNRNSFELRSGSFVNTVPRKYDDNSSLSISDCRDICWKDYQCVGVRTVGNNANNTGCTFFYGSFTQDLSGNAIQYHIIVQGSSAAVGTVLIMVLAGILIYLRRRSLRVCKVLDLDQSKREIIDWKKRFEIIEGIAQGLLYLHKYSRLRIIHRDLKASNIVLDENLNPKISDFGMARIFKINDLQANTNQIVGTRCYMSPEYVMEGIFSVKSDVFSFGVLLLEIVSDKRIQGLLEIDGHPLNLVGYAWELWKAGIPFELVDPILRESCSKDQVLRCINVGLLCVEDSATDRPTRSDVVSMLTSEAQLPLPRQPAFQIQELP